MARSDKLDSDGDRVGEAKRRVTPLLRHVEQLPSPLHAGIDPLRRCRAVGALCLRVSFVLPTAGAQRLKVSDRMQRRELGRPWRYESPSTQACHEHVVRRAVEVWVRARAGRRDRELPQHRAAALNLEDGRIGEHVRAQRRTTEQPATIENEAWRG